MARITLEEFIFILNSDNECRISVREKKFGDCLLVEWKSDIKDIETYNRYKDWHVLDFSIEPDGMDIQITL